MNDTVNDASAPGTPDSGVWARTAAQPQYTELKRRYKRFVLPIVLATLAWYFAYVLLATFARDFMSTPVFGNINIGLLFGLSQFVVSFTFATLYIRFANRRLDPLADELRDAAAHDAEVGR